MLQRLRMVLVGSVVGSVLYVAPVHALAASSSALPVPTAIAASTASDRFKNSWSWYVSRASGILAAILLALLIISGIGLLTGYTYRLLEPLPAWAAHRAIGLSFGVLTLIHIFVLLFDKYIGFSLADLLIPFYSKYRPVEIGGMAVGLNVALGVIALYFIVAIIITSLLWMQKRPKPWRLIHYLSYAAVGLVFVHGLFAGSDLKQGLLRWAWIAAGVGLIVAIVPRLRRAGTLDKDIS